MWVVSTGDWVCGRDVYTLDRHAQSIIGAGDQLIHTGKVENFHPARLFPLALLLNFILFSTLLFYSPLLFYSGVDSRE